MALAALIAARHDADSGAEGLRAALPLAGRTLLEHQARLAVRAGAEHVVVLVERLPAALIGAVDRLRHDGVRVEIARTLADAVDRIHPDEALLLFADGCVAGPATVARLAGAIVPAVLTLPDTPENAGFERIDAQARWAGLLLIDGARLRRTAEALGEWDLESTLLRRAVQAGAARVDAADDPALRRVDGAPALAGLDRLLLAAPGEAARDWPARLLFPPIVRLATPPLVTRGIDAELVAMAAAGLAGLAALVALLSDWPGIALALLLASGPVAAIADRIATARLSLVRGDRRFASARDAAAALALAGLADLLARDAGWGVWPVAAIVLLAAAATAAERAQLRATGGAAPRWVCGTDALGWALLPFALAGHWLPGLGALAVYALASAALVQRAVGLRLRA